MNVGVIIQARLGSHRLPGKVLKHVRGKTVLEHVVQRARSIRGVNRVILATTIRPEDEAIVAVAHSLYLPTFRGPALDVLDRYYQAATKFEFDTIVRITADCPLLDPEVSSQVLSRYLKGGHDYVSNVHPATFPDGLDTEVFSYATLQKAWRKAKDAYDTEHVTPFIWRWPSPFKLANVWNDVDLSSHRWTLDTQDDLDFIRKIYGRLDGPFGMKEVLNLLEQEPALAHTLPRQV